MWWEVGLENKFNMIDGRQENIVECVYHDGRKVSFMVALSMLVNETKLHDSWRLMMCVFLKKLRKIKKIIDIECARRWNIHI